MPSLPRLIRSVVAGVFLLSMLSGCQPMREQSPEPAIGARVPWTRHEAEAARSNVKASAPGRAYLTPESEASGRRLVRLADTGDYVEFAVGRPGDGLVLRYCLPDSADGQGLDATLSLYVNGLFRRKLDLTSRYSWIYGDFPWTNNPAAGRGHHFWDEVQTVVPNLAPGDKLRLQKDARDDADYVLIDFIELEKIPPPLPQPEGSLSLTEFGAVPDDDGNDDDAFMAAMEAAKAQGRVLWIPPGTFILDGGVKGLGGVEIQGAGMWHSRLTGSAPKFHGYGERIRVSDLAIIGQVNHRDDHFPDNAFTGNLGENSEIARVWVEHLKCGVWSSHGTKNLRITGCRFRNLMADGVNLFDGTADSVVEQCHLRNTGDDALATWSPAGDWSSQVACERNRFLFNTVETPWHANGIGLYGGRDHEVRGNLVTDTVQSGGGILISSGHGAIPFGGTIRVESNTFIRTGGDCYIDGVNGGVWIHAHESDIEALLEIRGLEIIDPLHAGITIHGPQAVHDLRLNRVTLAGPDLPLVRTESGPGVVKLTIDGVPTEMTGGTVP